MKKLGLICGMAVALMLPSCSEDGNNDDEMIEETQGCLLTTACGTTELPGNSGFSASSEQEGTSYRIIVTDQSGMVVHEEVCETDGSISIDCGSQS